MYLPLIAKIIVFFALYVYYNNTALLDLNFENVPLCVCVCVCACVYVCVGSVITISKLSGQRFTTVETKFTRAWAIPKGVCPEVSWIFQVTNTILRTRWKTHRETLHTDFQIAEEYYHGTKLTCNITTTHALCTDMNCGICGICRRGPDQNRIGKNIPHFQRFGHGFYLAPNSSKCHDYTQGAHSYRAMLLCEVIVGRKYMTKYNARTLNAPPPGYDSVYGQCGGSLNYDEVVVYNMDCVMPRYVCVYKHAGIHRLV